MLTKYLLIFINNLYNIMLDSNALLKAKRD